MFPRWSPDGGKIVFARGVNTAFSVIHVFDLASHQISTLPESQGYYSPHWSPDGRYIAAMPRGNSKYRSLRFFRPGSGQNWHARQPVSQTGRRMEVHLFLRTRQNPAVPRVRIGDRKAEEVPDLKGLPTTGYWGISLALTPDDSPLLLRNFGTQDVYALDWNAP
jgi:hypothetical protein